MDANGLYDPVTEGISDAYNHSAYLDAGWLTIHHPYLSCVLRGDPNLPASLQSAYEVRLIHCIMMFSLFLLSF